MKLFNNKQLMLRVTAVSAESVLFYIGFLLANQMAGGSRINIVFFVITALCGLFSNFVPYNNCSKQRQSLIFGSAGLVVAAVSISISAIKGYNAFAIPVAFIVLVFLYYRSHTSYFVNIFYIYNAESFYQRTGLLFLANALAFFGRDFAPISDELMRYSILYMIIALYMLSAVKKFRYANKSENPRSAGFDIAATSFIIIITIVVSIPKVLNALAFPFIAAFKFIDICIAKIIVVVSYPFSLSMVYLQKLIGPIQQLAMPSVSNENALNNDSIKYIPSSLLKIIGRVLAVIVMFIICAYVTCLLFKFINRITGTQEEDDFVEDKEFILRSNKEKSPGILSGLANSIKQAAGNISFMLTASNKDKLRHEYKVFIQKLYSKKVIESYNHTSQDVLQMMLSIAPKQREEINSITDMYEEVRYGVRYPGDVELKNFKKNLAEISKSIQ